MLILWQAVGLVRRGDVHNTCTYCKSMDYNTRQERIRTGGGKNQLTPPVNSYISWRMENWRGKSGNHLISYSVIVYTLTWCTCIPIIPPLTWKRWNSLVHPLLSVNLVSLMKFDPGWMGPVGKPLPPNSANLSPSQDIIWHPTFLMGPSVADLSFHCNVVVSNSWSPLWYLLPSDPQDTYTESPMAAHAPPYTPGGGDPLVPLCCQTSVWGSKVSTTDFSFCRPLSEKSSVRPPQAYSFPLMGTA